VRLLWATEPNATDIHKKTFLVYGGECLSCKAVHSWVANISLMTKRMKRRWGNGWVNSQKTAVGFKALAKRWDNYVNVSGGYVEKCIFSGFEYHVFYVLYPFVTYLRTLPRTYSFFSWYFVCPLLHGYLGYVRRFVNHPPSTDITQYHAVGSKQRKHTTTAVHRNKCSHTPQETTE
jgi:hypothetical protein